MPMPKFIDLTSQKFGKLLVLEKSNQRTGYGYVKWKCLCECGKIIFTTSQQLRLKGTKSCGCLISKINSERSKGNKYGFKHGLSYHPLRFIRKSMIHRCYNINNPFYKTYGGRNIKVCKEWLYSLELFVKWAEKNGWKKGLSIDRKDNDKDYTPENCHWISIQENSRKNMKKLWEEDKWRKRKKK